MIIILYFIIKRSKTNNIITIVSIIIILLTDDYIFINKVLNNYHNRIHHTPFYVIIFMYQLFEPDIP